MRFITNFVFSIIGCRAVLVLNDDASVLAWNTTFVSDKATLNIKNLTLKNGKLI